MELRNDKKHDSVSQPRACTWAARQSQDATVSMWADRFSGEQLALGLPRWHSGKNPPANAGDARDVGSTPGSGRSPGREHGNPLQYSCLENSMDRGAWWATVHGVTKSRTWLSDGACKYQYVCYSCRMNSASTRGVEVFVKHPGEDIWAWAWPKIWQEDKDIGESTAWGKRREGSLETWVQILREQQY